MVRRYCGGCKFLATLIIHHSLTLQILPTVTFLFFMADSTDFLDCLPILQHIGFYFFIPVSLFSFWFRVVD